VRPLLDHSSVHLRQVILSRGGQPKRNRVCLQRLHQCFSNCGPRTTGCPRRLARWSTVCFGRKRIAKIVRNWTNENKPSHVFCLNVICHFNYWYNFSHLRLHAILGVGNFTKVVRVCADRLWSGPRLLKFWETLPYCEWHYCWSHLTSSFVRHVGIIECRKLRIAILGWTPMAYGRCQISS
jgi:hypothetical protein